MLNESLLETTVRGKTVAVNDDLFTKIADLQGKLKAGVKDLKKKSCRHCKSTGKKLKENGLCDDCDLTLSEKRKAALASKRNESNGYVYVYDENGKSVPEHRLIMEKMLGRKLNSYEVVLHADGDKKNNDPTNLLLGFKNGTPLIHLQCTECQSVGKFTFLTEHTFWPRPMPHQDQEIQISPDPFPDLSL